MKRFLSVLAVLALSIPVLAQAEPEIKTKAQKLTITGRVHAQFFHSSVEGDPTNEFFIRRARATVKVQMNDIWSGEVQPDFGAGELSLKNAFVRAKPKSGVWEFTFGQTKRPFDLFELTSSTEILVIERDGRLGRHSIVSLSRLTEKLGYSDRDIGFFAAYKPKSERFNVYGGVSNGSGANTKAEFTRKAYQGRLTVQPIADQKWELYAGVSTRPYAAAKDTVGGTEEKYATAFEVSTQYGEFTKGAIVQAGFVSGHNWNGEKTGYNPASDLTQSPPTFMALQGIIAYTKDVRDTGWFRAVRPGVRVGWADADTDGNSKYDSGLLITPGVDFINNARNRVAINVDIFVPEDNPNITTDTTEFSTKLQTFLYW